VGVGTSYNILIRRMTLNTLKAMVFTPHMAMKFPIDEVPNHYEGRPQKKPKVATPCKTREN